MNDLRLARKHRAMLISVAANGHNVVKSDVFELIDVLRVMMRDIYSRLCHDFHGAPVQTMCFDIR